jgi:hypothetical protein
VSEVEPIFLRPDQMGANQSTAARSSKKQRPVCFTRAELNQILSLYGRKVASGEWRDYALDMGREAAVFSIFRRTSEMPLYRIEKNPKLARRQGAFSVIAASGQILKRGADLDRVLMVLDKRLQLVGG